MGQAFKESHSSAHLLPGEANLDIKVTCIDERWHARLIDKSDDRVIDEMACKNRHDIGWICREMLRWFAKTGGDSRFADAARARHNGKSIPTEGNPLGEVWYYPQLLSERQRRLDRMSRLPSSATGTMTAVASGFDRPTQRMR